MSAAVMHSPAGLGCSVGRKPGDEPLDPMPPLVLGPPPSSSAGRPCQQRRQQQRTTATPRRRRIFPFRCPPREGCVDPNPNGEVRPTDGVDPAAAAAAPAADAGGLPTTSCGRIENGLVESLDMICCAATDGICAVGCGAEEEEQEEEERKGTAPIASQAEAEAGAEETKRGEGTASCDGDAPSSTKPDECRKEEEGGSKEEAGAGGAEPTATASQLPSPSRPVRPASQQHQQHQPRPRPGLQNLGNTCYLNSALQMLMTLEGFVDDVLDRSRAGVDRCIDYGGASCGAIADAGEGCGAVGGGRNSNDHIVASSFDLGIFNSLVSFEEEKKEEEAADGGGGLIVAAGDDEDGSIGKKDGNSGVGGEEDKNGQPDDGPSRPLHDALGRVFSSLRGYGGPSPSVPGADAEAVLDGPSRTSSALGAASGGGIPVDPKDLKEVVGKHAPQFVGFEQQDSHEFLGTLLDLLHDEVRKAEGKNEEKEEEGEEKEEKEAEGGDEAEGEDESMEEDDEEEEEAAEIDALPDDEDGGDGDDLSAIMEVQESSSEEVEAPCKRARRGTGCPTPNLVPESDAQDDDFVEEKEEEGCDAMDGKSDDAVAAAAAATEGGGGLGGPSPPPRAQSFSKLSVAAISRLLHGKKKTKKRRKGKKGGSSTGGAATAEGDDCGAAGPSSGSRTASSFASSSSSEPSSPVEAHFATEIRTWLTCDSCKYARSNVEMYRYLSLDVSTHGEGVGNSGVGRGDSAASAEAASTEATTLEESIRRFFAPERREVKCEKCFGETATQTSEIARLPRALLLHLKRFIVHVAPDYSSVSYAKDARPVEFGEKIVLAPEDGRSGGGGGALGEYMASDCVVPGRVGGRPVDDDDAGGPAESDGARADARAYRLRGIVNHIGQSANRGHYTADAYTGSAKHGGGPEEEKVRDDSSHCSEDEKTWTRFNDSYVTKISAEEALGPEAQKTAYMVLYALS